MARWIDDFLAAAVEAIASVGGLMGVLSVASVLALMCLALIIKLRPPLRRISTSRYRIIAIAFLMCLAAGLLESDTLREIQPPPQGPDMLIA